MTREDNDKRQDGFEYVTQNWDELRSYVRRLCSSRLRDMPRDAAEALLDEMMSDVVVDKIPRAVERFEYWREVPLDYWVKGTIRRFLAKWFRTRRDRYSRQPRRSDVSREDKHSRRSEVPDTRSTRDSEDLELQQSDAMESLEVALRDLSYEDRAVLVMRFVAGYRLEDVAVALGCSKGKAHSVIQRALQRARDANDVS